MGGFKLAWQFLLYLIHVLVERYKNNNYSKRDWAGNPYRFVSAEAGRVPY